LNKTAASATQLAKCILLHASTRTTVAPSCARTNKNCARTNNPSLSRRTKSQIL